MKLTINFLKAYVKSMRLYYAFVTGISGWLGIAYYQYIADENYFNPQSGFIQTLQEPTPLSKKIVIIVILFLAWGVNQIINDYLGLKEDRVNAPDRPMVTGELKPRSAITFSIILLTGNLFITWFYLEPIAVVPLIVGIGLNVLYEEAKGYGIWGNIVFGVMIAMCGLFGCWAAGPTDTYFTRSTISALLFIMVTNGLMTYYTYFKDATGDKLAGKNTIVVKYGLEKNRYIAIFASFLPAVLFITGYFGFHAFQIELNNIFIILGLLTIFLQIWTGVQYYRNPKGELTYYSLATNIRACTCAQTAIIALFNPELGMILFIITYVFVGFLFNLNTNIKV
ncbi:MAG: UbiA family prenyltransferase [Bacteroidetes bacterium]|nr:UbiA family prenyltransferase [Bacteroidota bacterium]